MRLFDIEYRIGSHNKKELVKAHSATRAIRMIQSKMSHAETKAFRIVKVTLL